MNDKRFNLLISVSKHDPYDYALSIQPEGKKPSLLLSCQFSKQHGFDEETMDDIMGIIGRYIGHKRTEKFHAKSNEKRNRAKARYIVKKFLQRMKSQGKD